MYMYMYVQTYGSSKWGVGIYTETGTYSGHYGTRFLLFLMDSRVGGHWAEEHSPVWTAGDGGLSWTFPSAAHGWPASRLRIPYGIAASRSTAFGWLGGCGHLGPRGWGWTWQTGRHAEAQGHLVRILNTPMQL